MEKNEVALSDSSAQITPNNLMLEAVKNGASVENLEKLMDLQERWERKQAEKSFNEAFALFQGECPEIHKSRDVSTDGGKSVRYRFTPLQTIQKIVNPILSKNGLSVSWRQKQSEGNIEITCIVKHTLGHYEETSLSASPDTSGGKNAVQAIGSAVSYLKRYTLMNALGLSTDDDDDANSTQFSKDELNQILHDKLVSLMELKKPNINNEKLLKRITEVIDLKETSSYKKAIQTLEQL